MSDRVIEYFVKELGLFGIPMEQFTPVLEMDEDEGGCFCCHLVFNHRFSDRTITFDDVVFRKDTGKVVEYMRPTLHWD